MRIIINKHCALAFIMAMTPLGAHAQDVPIKRPQKTSTEESKPMTKPKVTTATLIIECIPNASVEIDGVEVGKSPITLNNQKPGRYNVTFKRDGFETFTRQAIVYAGKTTTCRAKLKDVVKRETFTVNGVSFNMILVEGGTFTMGATPEQGNDAGDDEKPAHDVTLSSYYIGETEVTQALWQAVMGNNPSCYRGEELPVEQVSWDDCQTFINKLNSITGKIFRLPTEAEWEFAARGGKKSKGYKYSGSNHILDVAWIDSNSGSSTHPVKTKSSNELGIYDMSGNVWEWCLDWTVKYSSTSQKNPKGACSSTDHNYRGGGWNSDAKSSRVSYRHYRSSDFRFCTLGLRLAM